MSLKAFHVFFVTVATVFAVFFGVWCLRSSNDSYTALGAVFMAAAVALVVYGVWFLRKTKGVSYL